MRALGLLPADLLTERIGDSFEDRPERANLGRGGIIGSGARDESDIGDGACKSETSRSASENVNERTNAGFSIRGTGEENSMRMVGAEATGL